MDQKPNEPLISVVIPAYNCERFIGKTLDSVLNQTYENLEAIVVNDCSTDLTEEIVKQYAEKDKRVRYLKNAKNCGVSYSRNLGVRQATGEWIALVDSDDYWQREKLTQQMERIGQTNGFMCSTARILIDEEGRPLGRTIPVPDMITYEMLLRTNYIVCSSVLVKKSILNEFPMDHDELHEDYVCWLQISQKYGAIAGMNEQAVYYRVSKTSKAGNKWKSFLMQKKSYQYLGITFWKKWSYLLSYSVNGVRKYGRI